MYFEAESSGTISFAVKRDRENAWQTNDSAAAAMSKSLVNSNGNESVALEFNTDFLARHFLMRISATNTFRFLGLVVEYDPEYGTFFSVN